MDETALWLAIGAGAAATYFWRALGVALSGRISVGGGLFEWVACVAYALLAGLIARMIVLPVGPLQDTAHPARLGAAAAALAVYFLLRRNLVLGIAAGVGFLAAAIHWNWFPL